MIKYCTECEAINCKEAKNCWNCGTEFFELLADDPIYSELDSDEKEFEFFRLYVR